MSFIEASLEVAITELLSKNNISHVSLYNKKNIIDSNFMIEEE